LLLALEGSFSGRSRRYGIVKGFYLTARVEISREVLAQENSVRRAKNTTNFLSFFDLDGLLQNMRMPWSEPNSVERNSAAALRFMRKREHWISTLLFPLHALGPFYSRTENMRFKIQLAFHALRRELRPTLRLALPLVFAEIGWMSMCGCTPKQVNETSLLALTMPPISVVN
jgi:hypothetical protein